jgi:hypothetical protein
VNQAELFWGLMIICPAVLAAGVTFAVCRYYYCRAMERKYLEGVQDGHKLEVKWATERAVELYKQDLHRKMVQTGRRTVARPGAEPARIHRARVANPRLPRQPESD